MGIRKVPLTGVRTNLTNVILALQYARRLCPGPKEQRVLDLGLDGATALGRLLGIQLVAMPRSPRDC
jgi:hypothetical protein